MMRWSLCAVLCTVTLLSVPGCIFDPDKEGGEGEDLLATPAGVIVHLADAYRRKDIDRYLACMVDTFEFHVIPRDQTDLSLPPTWGKVQEERIHRDMFGSMDHIELTLVGDYATKLSDNPETWRLYREFDLLVWETANELFEKGIGYGWAEFLVQKGDDDRYRLTDWYDLEQEP